MTKSHSLNGVASAKPAADEPVQKSVNFDAGEAKPVQATMDMSASTDEDFYEKILSLKEEHKKTLNMCERLYREKLYGNDKSGKRVATVTVANDFSMSPSSKQPGNAKQSEEVWQSVTGRDRVRDMSLPPSGRPRTAEGAMRRSRDMNREALNDSAVSGRSTVSGMWENFSVEDYVVQPRPKSASNQGGGDSKSAKDAANALKRESAWKHHITIPKPFNMTVREANKEKSLGLSKVREEVEKERKKKLKEEEDELQKKFKAQPIPAHVYMPLYEDILEQQESRRKQCKEKSQQLLKSQEKPFKFAKREDYKSKLHKLKMKQADMHLHGSKSKKHFKAKPFPEKLFEGTVNDFLDEQEQYRKIRVEMRAKELLQTSSLPPSMAARHQSYVDGKARQKMYEERAKKANMSDEHTFKPRTNSDMPNFDEIHRNGMKQMSKKKMERESTTVCKPFNLRTPNINNSNKVYDDIARDEETLPENRWPFKTPRAKPSMSSLSMSKSYRDDTTHVVRWLAANRHTDRYLLVPDSTS